MKKTRLVYSTEGGPARRPQAPRPAAAAPAAPEDNIVRIARETSGRGGKVVTVIRGFPERGPALEARAAELKRLCGAGGTVKDSVIELQGDQRQRAAEHLRRLGHRVKLAGG